MAEDKYVNQAYLSVVESALNTLTFSKIETGISIHEKVGWLISRIDYFFQTGPAQFGADGDALDYGISVMDTLTDVGPRLAAIVDSNTLTRQDWGVAASSEMRQLPVTRNFADLPGGGLLIPPNPVYIYARGTALAGPHTVAARLFYTMRQLKTEDFWELVEQRRMIGA